MLEKQKIGHRIKAENVLYNMYKLQRVKDTYVVQKC